MAGFLDRAKTQAQSALNQGKEKVEEVQSQREGAALLRKLGAAYFNEQRGLGSPQATQEAAEAVQRHLQQNGEDFITRS
ncbi:hypothetical protein G5C51_40095 [Streptomyces sp. A7024]|uniref:Uncharacterized protein n=1 Tax=Streptomyces coryli TaxID=1128680 RepID=A0A6G4UEP5_9ACTN|nr:hypothetical protein [Streptomyces coryli]NGN70078.1 hypothetical protein [Streptomyces coryli]